tara:strand:- start:7614 stop:7910 length:297 start_codon:yes stop_codon:yes gene_type:complete
MYIGYLNYFETGQGIRIILKTAPTVKELKEGIDDYFLMGFEIFDLDKVFEFSRKEKENTPADVWDVLETLRMHCPIAYRSFKKYGILDLKYEYSINLA